jgi:hypothetical protein
MSGNDARSARAVPLIAASLLLGACAGHSFGFGGHSDHNSDDNGINVYPANYKSDILAGMHAYLNDPTGIRDAAVSQPMLKSVANGMRYMVCLRFNGKQDDGAYAGDKQIAAVFLAGRFDDFVDTAAAREPCAGAVFAPFPELEQLKR